LRLARDASQVRIEVTDEGPGIAPGDRERVWRPYQRGSSASGTAGSGVGLSVVHDVVAQHGGRAWVDDTPAGRGARVVVTLPASGVAHTDRSTPLADDSAEDEAPAAVHG